jgi:hypothetical protein
MSVLGRRLRTVGTAAAACVVVVLSSGCGGDDGEAADDGTTTSASETTIASTTTTQDPEAEVEAAYLAYWEMAERLAQDPNPDDPEIAKRTTGSNRERVIDALSTLRAQNRAIRFGAAYAHSVLAVDLAERSAVVRDCSVDDATTIDASTNEPISEGVATLLLEATLTREGSQWLVETIDQVQVWEGATNCDI